jgi:hypothetical protein
MIEKAPFRRFSISELEKAAIYAKSEAQATTRRKKEIAGMERKERMKDEG